MINSDNGSFPQLRSAYQQLGPRVDELQQMKKKETAQAFEELFAKHLVREMTEGSFEMGKGEGILSQGSSLYRRHVTETLAGQLASEQALGMHDLVMKFWNRFEQ